ncbi:tripartite tricarboxylate transporter substrate binding protein [Cupriavidus pauculus]|uniref:Tripartite tricarboxylate transporter substrate binding protein n=1 Tax=Cupriavidus pauculus TaxID=82633 RepID=A0A5P2HDZ2_9BURK|nr:tripartite tricarboxylate transporter substrate binding protein [Cupriavidus pauculus]QET05240.1 tripartite tricarboxylate transporter substrate binding protein [Cupriavidus pauculus]
MTLFPRMLVAAALSLAALGHAVAAPDASPQAAPQAAGKFPSKPMRIVVPFPAGGYSDALARLIATDMSSAFGQPVVVENRPGAGGNIGADIVAKSPADGHTLVMGTIGTQVVNPLIYRNIPYNATKDFSAVAFVADAETVLVVNPKVPATTLTQVVALAKTRPNEMTFASGGTGTTSQLAGELFQSTAHVSMTHVPYKGNVPALSDVVGGQVAMSFATLAPALPFIKGGQLVPIATLGKARAQALPNTPTLTEAGLPGVEVRNWTGVLAPGGTPLPIREKLAAQVDKTMQSPTVRTMLEAQGLTYTKMGPDAFDSFMRAESVKWKKVVEQANIKAD